MTSGDPAPPRRLRNFTPLRYPGGKGKLAAYVKALMKSNPLLDGEYVEPYAGGAAIALELMFHEYVARIHINDVNYPVYAFWRAVLDHTEDLCRLVKDTPRTVEAWDVQKRTLADYKGSDVVKLGFALFFLNPTNRSGILNGGIIGGRDQTGPWKIDARYNADELVHRIEAIASMRSRISLTRMDAIKFLRSGVKRWPAKTLIYLDPPYYVKGRELYYDFYEHKDHEEVARFVTTEITAQKWIVSYDNVQAIRDLYESCRRSEYNIGYSARTGGMQGGTEVMFFSEGLSVPSPVGAMSTIGQEIAPSGL